MCVPPHGNIVPGDICCLRGEHASSFEHVYKDFNSGAFWSPVFFIVYIFYIFVVWILSGDYTHDLFWSFAESSS